MKNLFLCIAFAFRLPLVFSVPRDGSYCEIKGVNKVFGSILAYVDFNHLDSGNHAEGLLA